MIVSSLAEKDGLIQRFPFAPVKTQVFTMSEWEKMRHGRRDYELAVDNAEFVLERLLGSPIARMSMTKEVCAKPSLKSAKPSSRSLTLSVSRAAASQRRRLPCP